MSVDYDISIVMRFRRGQSNKGETIFLFDISTLILMSFVAHNQSALLFDVYFLERYLKFQQRAFVRSQVTLT